MLLETRKTAARIADVGGSRDHIVLSAAGVMSEIHNKRSAITVFLAHEDANFLNNTLRFF